MKQKIKLVILLVFLFGGEFVFTRTTGQMQTNQTKTAGEVYKNVQVLKDIPADQWDKVMSVISGSLGVKCNFCHIPEQWEKDEKEEKRTARKMMAMTLALNKENFGGRNEVSCATCHQGKEHPSSLPPLGQNAWQPVNAQPATTKESLPTIDQVLDKYVQATGGAAAIKKVTTRVLKGSRIGADGVAVPEEVYEKMPDKMLVITAYPEVSLVSASDGSRFWARDNKGETGKMPEEQAELFKWETQLLQPTKFKEFYKTMSVAGTEKIGGREVYLVRATTQNGKRERLYFDKQTGLLVRRFASSPTIIGAYPFQVDYSDYRAFDGVQIPMTVQWSIPGRVWGRKISEVTQNTGIDDAKFAAPK